MIVGEGLNIAESLTDIYSRYSRLFDESGNALPVRSISLKIPIDGIVIVEVRLIYEKPNGTSAHE